MSHADQPNRYHGARWLARILAFFKILMGLAAAASMAWLIVTLPVWFEGAPRLPLPVEITVSPDPALTASGTAESPFRASEVERMRGELEVKFENAWAQWLYVFFALQEFVLVFLILHFVSRIVGSIGEGRAFSVENAGRLRWVGGLMIIESIFGPGASTLVSSMALRGVEFAGGEISADWFRDFGDGSFVAAWIILILSEVFRQGAELKQEQSLTI